MAMGRGGGELQLINELEAEHDSLLWGFEGEIDEDDDEEKCTGIMSNNQKTKKKSKKNDGRGECSEELLGKQQVDEHELHIWTERERRKKMRNMFSTLHSLLPHLPPKSDKTSIVDEAIRQIKKLEQTLEDLQKQKLQDLPGTGLTIQSREAFLADQCSSPAPAPFAGGGADFPPVFKTWTAPNVTLSVCGDDAHFSLCSVRKPGLLTAVCFVVEKHKLDVVSVHASSNRNRILYMIHARLSANVASDRFLHAFPVEAIYKQAAAEIMLWMNS
ncbi:transcription factor bHLH95-like [Andrographis paniculata]|uniref:transcription factor bHLH95-like n=1 Tax=Andrographis paniculata TaxID=175694 RepID=UPI0021E8BC44|nr:transcription factor bHLH95-like [Andrographis paniculata]